MSLISTRALEGFWDNGGLRWMLLCHFAPCCFVGLGPRRGRETQIWGSWMSRLLIWRASLLFQEHEMWLRCRVDGLLSHSGGLCHCGFQYHPQTLSKTRGSANKGIQMVLVPSFLEKFAVLRLWKSRVPHVELFAARHSSPGPIWRGATLGPRKKN